MQTLGNITVTAAGSGTMTFNSSGQLTGQTGSLTITPTDGAASVVSALDMSTVTHSSGRHRRSPLRSQNGSSPGTLQSFQIGPSGTS